MINVVFFFSVGGRIGFSGVVFCSFTMVIFLFLTFYFILEYSLFTMLR